MKKLLINNLIIFTLCGLFITLKVYANTPVNWTRLVSAVITAESKGDPFAYNRKSGCVGLMQVSAVVLDEWIAILNKTGCFGDCVNISRKGELYNIGDLYNPAINVKVGSWYLKRIWNHYLPHYKLEQNLFNLCAAYQAGIGTLVKYKQGKVKLSRETLRYIRQVKRLYYR